MEEILKIWAKEAMCEITRIKETQDFFIIEINDTMITKYDLTRLNRMTKMDWTSVNVNMYGKIVISLIKG